MSGSGTHRLSTPRRLKSLSEDHIASTERRAFSEIYYAKPLNLRLKARIKIMKVFLATGLPLAGFSRCWRFHAPFLRQMRTKYCILQSTLDRSEGRASPKAWPSTTRALLWGRDLLPMATQTPSFTSAYFFYLGT